MQYEGVCKGTDGGEMQLSSAKAKSRQIKGHFRNKCIRGHNMMTKVCCYICGAKCVGGYGGYETFLDKLTEYHQDNENIQYKSPYR